MAFFDFLHIFTDLFDAAERAWHKLEPKVQEAMIHGSAIVKILYDTVEETPDEVFAFIQKKFPNLDKEHLEAALNKLAEVLNIPTTDLLTTIQHLQNYLLTMSAKEGSVFDPIRSAMAQILAIALAPGQTLAAKISALIEWVFRHKVKEA